MRHLANARHGEIAWRDAAFFGHTIHSCRPFCIVPARVHIPADASSGDVPIVIQVGNAKSQAGVTISVK